MNAKGLAVNLPPRYEKFARLVAAGSSGREAAALSFDCRTPGSQAVQACRVLKKPEVRRYIRRLLEDEGLTIDYVVSCLREIVEGVANDGTKVAALRLLGRYLDMWKPEKPEQFPSISDREVAWAAACEGWVGA